MFYLNEPVEARCYLGNDEDEKNVAFLTNSSVIICRSGRNHSFRRVEILSLTFIKKTYLIAIVTGGIIAPLGILALMNDMGNVWWLMITIVVGLLIHYYGWVGGMALVVHTRVKEYDIFLPQLTNNLQAFVSYVNWQLRSSDRNLYLEVSLQDWEKFRDSGFVPSGTEIQFNKPAGSLVENHVILSMDALASPVRLSFHSASHGNDIRATLSDDFPVQYIRRL